MDFGTSTSSTSKNEIFQGDFNRSFELRTEEIPEILRDKILVPFCVESALSGVMRTVGEREKMVYRRTFKLEEAWRGRRIKLMFQAVDYEAEVAVNGRQVGRHTGGYDSFGFDITDSLSQEEDLQTVTVIVKDPTENKVSYYFHIMLDAAASLVVTCLFSQYHKLVIR